MALNMSPVFPFCFRLLLLLFLIPTGQTHTRNGGYKDPPCLGNRTVILEVRFNFGAFSLFLLQVFWMALERHCREV